MVTDFTGNSATYQYVTIMVIGVESFNACALIMKNKWSLVISSLIDDSQIYQVFIVLIDHKGPTSLSSWIILPNICNRTISNLSILVLCLYLTYIEYT